MKFMKSKFKKIKFKAALFILCCGLIMPQASFAAPSGGILASGSATISAPNAATTLINNMSDKVIINWNTFGINPSELVQFIQPFNTSVALNRVISLNNPSLIQGALQSNGRIFLVNPSGIVFGNNAVVNVGGLVASTLSIKDSDFLNGNYTFLQDPAIPQSFVVNQGSITANNGYVAFLAPVVDNEGAIQAPQGKIGLAAATNVILNPDASGLVNFITTAAPSGAPGDVTGPSAGNTTLLNTVVNNHDIVAAGSVVNNGDNTVTLTASSGLALNGGTLQTSGSSDPSAGINIVGAQAVAAGPAGLASTDNQPIFVSSAGNLNFAPGSVTQSTAGDINFTANGNTVLTGLSAGGAANVTSANSYIITSQNGSSNPDIAASAINLNAAGDIVLNTQTSNLTTTTGPGASINIANTGGLKSLSTTMNGGNAFIGTDGGAFFEFNNSDGSLSANLTGTNFAFNNTGGNIAAFSVYTGSGNTSLSAGGSITAKGETPTITANQVNLTAGAGIAISTQTSGLVTTTTGPGATTVVSNTGDLAGLSTTTNNGDASITTDGGASLNFTASSGTLDGNLNGTNLAFNNTGGDILADNINVGGGAVALNASGAITGTAASPNLTANQADLQAANGITLSTAVSNLDALNTTAGDINLTNTGNVTVDQFGLTSGAGLLNNAGNINFTNHGSINFPGTNAPMIAQTTNANVQGNIDLSADQALSLPTGSVSAANGNISVSAGTDLAIGSGSLSSGHGDVLTTAGNNLTIGSASLSTQRGDVDATAGQDLTIGSGSLATNRDDVNLNAGNNLTMNGSSLSSARGAISATSGQDMMINGGALSTARGEIDLTAGNNFTMNSGSIAATVGALNATAANNLTVNGGSLSTASDPLNLTAGTNALIGPASSVTSNSGYITVMGASASVTNLNGGGGVGVTASNGDITSSQNGTANPDITGNIADLQATNGIALSTAVSNLDALNTASGDINLTNNGNVTVDQFGLTSGAGILNNAGNITLTNNGNMNLPGVNAPVGLSAPNGNVTVNAAGDLSLGAVSSGGSVNLSASKGSILNATPGASTNVTAQSDSSLSAQGTIGTDQTPLSVQVNGALNVAAGGSVQNTSVNVNGAVSPSGTLTVASTIPGSIIFNGVCQAGCPSSTTTDSGTSTGGSTTTDSGTAASASTSSTDTSSSSVSAPSTTTTVDTTVATNPIPQAGATDMLLIHTSLDLWSNVLQKTFIGGEAVANTNANNTANSGIFESNNNTTNNNSNTGIFEFELP